MTRWSDPDYNVVNYLNKVRKRLDILTAVPYRIRQDDLRYSDPGKEYRFLYWDLMEVILDNGTYNLFKKEAIRMIKNLDHWRFKALIEELHPIKPLILNYTPDQIYEGAVKSYNGPIWTG